MYKIAIVEDEPEYQSQLKRYIQVYEREHEDCFDVHVFSDGWIFWTIIRRIMILFLWISRCPY